MTLRRSVRVFALLLFAPLGLAAHAQLRIVPPDPQAGEITALVGAYRTGAGCYFATTSARIVGNEARVESPRVVEGVSPFVGWCRLGATIGALPAGTYRATSGPLTNPPLLGPLPEISLGFDVSPALPAAPEHRGLDGNWFDPREAGWGMNLVQGASGILFGVWLTYQPTTGNQDTIPVKASEWIVMPGGRWVSPSRFRGLLFASMGAPVDRGVDVSYTTPIGMATITFTDRTRARLSIEHATFFGEWFQQEWNVQRLEF